MSPRCLTCPRCARKAVFNVFEYRAGVQELTPALTQVYIFTHDSVGVGEDGPTHQPVETVASMRLMPNMDGMLLLLPWR